MDLTPGRGYDNSRLADTELQQRQLEDRLAGGLRGRDAAPPVPFVMRRGKHRGKTTTSCSKDSTCTVRIWYWNGEAYADSGVDVTARCWFLNEGDEIAAGYRVLVELMADNQWEIVNAWCDEADDNEA